MAGASPTSPGTDRTDFEVLFDLVSNPTVLVDRHGSVVAANAAAHETMIGVAVDVPLPVPEASRAAFERWIGHCLTTSAPVPGTVILRHADGQLDRHPARGVRAQLPAFGDGAMVLLQIDAVVFDRRFKVLADRLNDARRVMRERRLRARQMRSLMEEREGLLARLETDAAARAAAERERDEVLGQLYRAGQDERRRLARDLHDHAGQHLMVLKFGLRRLEKHLTTPAAQGELARLLDQAQDVGDALRRVTLALRPAALEEFGFVTAVRYLVEEWGRMSGTSAEFQVGGSEVPLAPDHAITLYRLVQEALTNVAKHAGQPACVSVVLVFGRTHLTLSIDDDGEGFETASATALFSQGKLGLVGMRERVSLVGGTLDIDSEPGHGTSITARVRVMKDDPDDA